MWPQYRRGLRLSHVCLSSTEPRRTSARPRKLDRPSSACCRRHEPNGARTSGWCAPAGVRRATRRRPVLVPCPRRLACASRASDAVSSTPATSLRASTCCSVSSLRRYSGTRFSARINAVVSVSTTARTGMFGVGGRRPRRIDLPGPQRREKRCVVREFARLGHRARPDLRRRAHAGQPPGFDLRAVADRRRHVTPAPRVGGPLGDRDRGLVLCGCRRSRPRRHLRAARTPSSRYTCVSDRAVAPGVEAVQQPAGEARHHADRLRSPTRSTDPAGPRLCAGCRRTAAPTHTGAPATSTRVVCRPDGHRRRAGAAAAAAQHRTAARLPVQTCAPPSVDQPSDGRRGHRRATTAGPTRGSSGLGTMYSASEVFADNPEDRLGGSDLHLLGDPAGTGVQRAAEHTGERQHVVDLVQIIAAPGRHDGGVLGGDLGMDLRVGVGQREHDAVRRHRRDQLLGHDAARKPEEHVGALERLDHAAGQAVGVGARGQIGLHRGQIVAVADAGCRASPAASCPKRPRPEGCSRTPCLLRRHRRSPRAATTCRGRAPSSRPSSRRARRSRCRAGRRASPGSRAPRSGGVRSRSSAAPRCPRGSPRRTSAAAAPASRRSRRDPWCPARSGSRPGRRTP